MVVRNVTDAVDHRIAEMDIGRGHVDLGAQAPLAVGVLAVAHLAEDPEVALGVRIARRRGAARLLGDPTILLPLVLPEIAAVRLPAADEFLGDLVHLVEHVGGVVEAGLAAVAFARPLETEPVDVALDVLGVFVRFLGGIGVVEPQMALAAEKRGHSEIDAHRLGVSDMDVAVGFGRKTGDHLAAGLAVFDVLLDPLSEKMPGGI